WQKYEFKKTSILPADYKLSNENGYPELFENVGRSKYKCLGYIKSNLDQNKFNELFKKFSNYPHNIKNTLQTFLEVTRYPHYEKVSSNILAYFLNASGQHGMKDLFLKSLVETVIDNQYLTDNMETQVITEYPTLKGGRIDILIETDLFLIIIENKINAPVYNNLEDYYITIEEVKKENIENTKTIIPIVLSINEDNYLNTEKSSEFYYITYEKFLSRVKANLGDYIDTANSEWLIFLRNFINTMQNLREEGKMGHDEHNDRIDFFDKNETVIRELIEEHKILMEFFKKEVGAVVREIGDRLNQRTFKIYSSNIGLKDSIASAYYTFSREESAEKNIGKAYEIVRCLKGWEILLNAGTKNSAVIVKAWLSENKIPIESEEIVGYEHYVPLWSCKDNGLNVKEVADKAVSLFNMVSK
ncbi:MAG: PD-(D/E)XK nuclease family protein, partial [Candidatus Cloacimonetes bacterium]|nr:PD-(D/E)XK nuclease family protein [Candidatus Cloacimonadota bacterium]